MTEQQQELEALKNVTISDLSLLDAAVSNLSKSIKTIISLCPELELVDPSKNYKEYDEVLLMMNRPRLLLARALKQSYSRGDFELAHQLAAISKDHVPQNALDFSKITAALPFEFQKLHTSSKSNKKYDKKSNDKRVVRDSSSMDDDDGKRPGKRSRTWSPSDDAAETTSNNNVVVLENVTNTGDLAESEKEKRWPPELPVIHDKILEKQVFTHKSSANEQMYYLDKKELLHLHNERLEFLGDTVLNFFASVIIYRQFPDATEGDLTNIRASLVCNATIGEWATAYELDKRLHTKFALMKGGEDGGKKSKIIADVFEAYVAGVMSDSPDGLQIVGNWLSDLMAPYINSIKLKKQSEELLNKEAKNMLHGLVGTGVEYVTTSMGNSMTPFTVECRYKGQALGTGVGASIRSAGSRAAMAALNSKKLAEIIESRRTGLPGGEEESNVSVSSAVAKNTDSAHESSSHTPSPSLPPWSSSSSNGVSNNSNSPTLSASGTPSTTNNSAAIKKQTGAKDVLYSIIGSADNRPLYKTRSSGKGFQSEVFMKGELLGRGSGKNKKEAEAAAAEDCLNNGGEALRKWSLHKHTYK